MWRTLVPACSSQNPFPGVRECPGELTSGGMSAIGVHAMAANNHVRCMSRGTLKTSVKGIIVCKVCCIPTWQALFRLKCLTFIQNMQSSA